MPLKRITRNQQDRPMLVVVDITDPMPIVIGEFIGYDEDMVVYSSWGEGEIGQRKLAPYECVEVGAYIKFKLHEIQF